MLVSEQYKKELEEILVVAQEETRKSREELKLLSKKKEVLNSEVKQMNDEYFKDRCINVLEWNQQTELLKKKKQQLEEIQEKYMLQKIFYARVMLEYEMLYKLLEK